ADTIFNNASGFSWSTTGQSGAYDLQNIGTHEFGHWLQLGDLYTARDRELTMYGYGATSETKKRDLGLGDTLGVQKIY
ncbi:MAG: matrixin family metalloprotease, partial [Patescibacteria group bacterium]